MQEVSRNEPDIPFIVLGDFNQTIGQLVGPLANPQNGLTLSIECENAAVCFKGHIDFVFPGGKTKLMERCQGTRNIDSREIDGDHVPVYAVIRLPESAKPGDLDHNGRIDIFDYNSFLGLFGRTGAPRFSPADIDGNGTVDIFDYNEMLKILATP